MIDRNHPAVLAGARGYYFDDDETNPESVEALNHPGPREAVHLPDIARTITAALPHLTADDLRNTPAGRALMAEGWEDAIYDTGIWKQIFEAPRNPYKETPNE